MHPRKSGLIALSFFLAAFSILRSAPVALGETMPDIVMVRPGGAEAKLSDYRGTVLLLEIWGTWCAPCQAIMPDVEALHQRLAPQGIKVLGVDTMDSQERFEAWVKKPRIKTSYEKFWDPAGRDHDLSLYTQWQLAGTPSFFLISKEGKLLFEICGAYPSTIEQIEAAVSRVVALPETASAAKPK